MPLVSLLLERKLFEYSAGEQLVEVIKRPIHKLRAHQYVLRVRKANESWKGDQIVVSPVRK